MRLTDSQFLPDSLPADETPAPAAGTPPQAKAKAAAEKFEAFFIAQMLHQMRRSSRELGSEEGGHGSRDNEMLDYADTLLADALAGRHAFGIADLILRQLLPASDAAASGAGSQGQALKSPPPSVALDK